MDEKNIPQSEIDNLARLLLPRILADYEREQGKQTLRKPPKVANC